MGLIADTIESDKILNPTGGCHNCPRKKRQFVPATLKETRLLILGEAPGPTDVKTGEPLTSESGQLFREVLQRAGITEFSTSNTIHCRPPKNQSPSKKEISCCLNQFVLDQVSSYEFVLLVGNVPMNALFPKLGADRLRGNLVYHPDFPDTQFFGCYHPAYMLRRPDLREEFENQINRLGRILAEGAQLDAEIISGEGAVEALDEMLATGFISLDIETDRLESWDPIGEIRSVAVAADEHRVVFVHNEENHWLGALSRIRKFLMDPSSKVLGHNIGFDLVWLEEKVGFVTKARSVLDTQSLYYLAKGDRMANLKMLVARELDGYRHQVWMPHKEKDLRKLKLYNAEDVIYPILLLRKGLSELEPKTMDLFFRASGPSGYHLRRMEHGGFYFDQELWEEASEQIERERQELYESWQEADPDFIPHIHASGKGVEQYLFKIKGYPVRKETPTGRPSTDSGAIKNLINELEQKDQDTRPLKNLLTLRRIDKEQSTYVKPYKGHVDSDGRVRSSYHNTVTDSGRRSSRNPNLQNLPREGPTRKFFRARPGRVLLQGDFSQIELRVAMCLAKDPAGIQAYQRGEDLHTETARAISGNPNPTKEERTRAKPVNFASLYGAHWSRLKAQAAEDYGIWLTDEEAEEYHRLFFQRYSRLPRWHQETHDELRANQGRAMQILGHPSYYKDWNHEDSQRRDHAFRAHLNSKCQGPAAYINMYTLILTDRFLASSGLPARIVHEEHDSILVEVKEKHVDDVAHLMLSATEKCAEWIKDWFVVPLIMDFELGPNRGELQDYIVR